MEETGNLELDKDSVSFDIEDTSNTEEMVNNNEDESDDLMEYSDEEYSDELEDSDEVTDDETDEEDSDEVNDILDMEALSNKRIRGPNLPEEGLEIKELVNGYFRQSDYSRRMDELKKEKTQFDSAINEAREKYTADATQLAERADALLELYFNTNPTLRQTKDWTQKEWSDLYRKNPAEYNRLKTDQEMAIADVQGIYQAREAHRTAQQEDEARMMQEKLQREFELIPEVIPEWANVETRTKELNAVIGWLKTTGFSDTDLGNLNEAKLYKVARDAWKYNSLVKNKQIAETKKTSKVQPVLKSTKNINQAPTVSKEVKQLKHVLANTRRTSDEWLAAMSKLQELENNPRRK